MASAAVVILVHGAWVDSTCWDEVIAAIELAGGEAVAVQLPLTSLTEDAAALREAIECRASPLVVVGHSYGGVVITEAAEDPRVAGLVYVAAFAPDVGEAAAMLTDGYPPSKMNAEVELEGGHLRLTRRGVDEGFAQDLDEARRADLFADQALTDAAVLGTPVTRAAWRSKRCWYLVATQDQAIPPALQQDLAARIDADLGAIASSHVPMLSQPDAVADFILGAVSELLNAQEIGE